MGGLKIRVIFSVTGTGSQPQSSHQGARSIRHHIAVFVRHNHDVKLLRIQDHLLAEIIDDLLFKGQFRILPRGFLNDLPE